MKDLFLELLQVSLGIRDELSRVPSAIARTFRGSPKADCGGIYNGRLR